MGEYFHRLVGEVAVLRALRDDMGEPSRVFVPRVDAAVGAVPITIQMGENVPAWYGPIGSGSARVLPPTDIAFGERMSATGAIAYVEAESQADIGHRAAALWQGGKLVFGLSFDDDDAPPPVWRPARRSGLARLFGRDPAVPPPVPRTPNPLDRAIAGVTGGVAESGTFERFGFMPIRSNEDLAYNWIEVGAAG